MNPRQRRGALLMALAVLGAVAVVAGLVVYVNDVQSQLGPMQTALRLTQDVARLEPIPPDAIEQVEMPEQWAPETALGDPREVSGSVAAAALPAGTLLQQGSLATPPEIESGQRELAILVDPETGVGGKIRAGDIVDIYATFPAEGGGGPNRRAERTEVALQAVRIVDTSPAVQAPSDEEDFSGQNPQVPVTFALSPDQAQELVHIESFATEVRLGLRVPSDTERLPESATTYTGGS